MNKTAEQHKKEEQQAENERAAWHVAVRLRSQGIHATPFYSGDGLGLWVPLDAADKLLDKP